jgi:hypothetical protein
MRATKPTECDPQQEHVISQFRLATDFLLRPLPQLPPQHFPNRTLRDFFNECNTASQLLVVRQPLFHKLLDLVFAQTPTFHGHDVGTWPVSGRIVGSWDANDRGFFDAGVCEEQVFELGWCDLEAFVFEEFLTCG